MARRGGSRPDLNPESKSLFRRQEMERTAKELRFKKKSGIIINPELYLNWKSDSTLARRSQRPAELYKKG
jgi:hypothetical protein